MKFKRIFVIVMDSVGVGAQEDAVKFGDVGTNTFLHTYKASNGLNLPNLARLGFYDLLPSIGLKSEVYPQSYVLTMNEVSLGKDTMTGHWELMGLQTVKPFKTFTDHGFPKALMDELQEKTGHRFIGNIASSGTEIIARPVAARVAPTISTTNEKSIFFILLPIPELKRI
jgi:phosphopentomutase